MKSINKLKILAVAILLMLPFAYNNCGQAYFQGPGSGSNSSEGDDVGTTRGNPMIPLRTLDFPIPSANFSFRFCLDQMKAKRADGTEFYFSVGGLMVELQPDGTILPEIDVPAGVYSSFDLFVSTTCGGTGHSTFLVNKNGNFSIFDTYVVHFEGNKTENRDGTPWLLDFDVIVRRLDDVTVDTQITGAVTINAILN